jgi:DNA-binding transcriptional ArsR family regulator
MLEDLIVSRVRVKILQLFFLSPDKIFHVREVVRRTDEEINAVRRELLHLEKAGLMSKERRANRLFYATRKDYPLYYDILDLIVKTSGMGGDIIKNRMKLGKIKFVMISGRYARGLTSIPNAVDLLVVGKVVIPELSQIVRQEELRREKEINYTVMSPEEYDFRKKRRDPFVLEILHGSRIVVIGDEEDLVM